MRQHIAMTPNRIRLNNNRFRSLYASNWLIQAFNLTVSAYRTTSVPIRLIKFTEKIRKLSKKVSKLLLCVPFGMLGSGLVNAEFAALVTA